MKSNTLSKIDKKHYTLLGAKQDEPQNISFTHAELREHSQVNPGRWRIMHEADNRRERRSYLTKKNRKRYLRDFPNQIDIPKRIEHIISHK